MSQKYDNPWKFEGKPFTSDDIGSSAGFVYIITCKKNGREYVGKKTFFFRVKRRGKRLKEESDWQKYYGSSKPLLVDVKKYGFNSFRRTILSVHPSAPLVTYYEAKEQFVRGVLESDTYYNNNILGKWSTIKGLNLLRNKK